MELDPQLVYLDRESAELMVFDRVSNRIIFGMLTRLGAFCEISVVLQDRPTEENFELLGVL